MVALWLRHDNDDDQGHSERNAPRIKKTRSGKSPQSEQRDNFYFRNNARWGAPGSCSNSPISELDQKICKAKVSQVFENDWRRNFMKITRFTFYFLLAMFLCGFGCSTPKPIPDPLVGFHEADLRDLHNNKAITDDYKAYIKTLSPDEQKYAGPILFHENGSGQHAVQIRIGLNGTVWEHVLIYDKDNKRIKTIKYSSGGYRS
jgi:hypothetical protein